MSSDRSVPYWVSFGALALASVGVLLAIVFAVFPQRFALVPGLREQGLTFPGDAPEFALPATAELVRPSPPDPAEAEPAPGPEERFWSRVDALRATGRDDLALREFRAWLRDHPDDDHVRLEYARTLERADRPVEAEETYAEVWEAAGAAGGAPDREVGLSLARLRWRLGDLEGSLAVYDALADRGPDDRSVREERAELLAVMGRYSEAAREYRALLEEAPPGEAASLRLSLARVLEASGSTVAAWRQASAVPDDAPEAAEADELRERLRARMTLPSPDTVVGAPLARARAAAAAGDLGRAERHYRAAVFLRPDDETPRLELAALLATRLDAPGRAATVLEAGRAADGGGSAELRRRLAHYRLWSGDDDGALRLLTELAEEGDATADDLALAAEILRWSGRRPEAAARYEEALALEPDHRTARLGRDALRDESRRAAGRRDPAGLGVETDLYLDSEDFRTWGVAGRAALDPFDGPHRLVARSGVRSVRGRSAAGGLDEDLGPTGEIGWIGWWRQATIRTALKAGAEHLGDAGTEAVVEAELGVPRLGLEASYRHGPAHPTTLTLASARDRTRIDRVQVALFRPLGGSPWDLWTSVEGASVRGGGVDNGRFVAQADVGRPVGLDGGLRAGYSTRLLTTSTAAPLGGDGSSTYWSPAVSWTHGLSLELQRPAEAAGWGWSARVRPGASLIRRHGSEEELEAEFNFAGGAGLEYRAGDVVVRLGADYLRTRLDGYEAFGADLGLTWRF